MKEMAIEPLRGSTKESDCPRQPDNKEQASYWEQKNVEVIDEGSVINLGLCDGARNNRDNLRRHVVDEIEYIPPGNMIEWEGGRREKREMGI